MIDDEDLMSQVNQEKKFFADLQAMLRDEPLAQSVEELKSMIEDGRR